MFDISWTEFLLIGIVALVVIGPKELPGVMRTLGQWTRKIRSMAADFQNQFQEAMREAEMADLKKQVDDMAQRHQELRSAQKRARRRRERWARTSRSRSLRTNRARGGAADLDAASLPERAGRRNRAAGRPAAAESSRDRAEP